MRLIPGIDICSGGETTLIGGMRMANQMFRVKVNYRPLNIADDLQYSLFVAFENNGVCTITPNFCDIALIHIDSYNQIANAATAPRHRISRIYGKGSGTRLKTFSGRPEFSQRHLVPSLLDPPKLPLKS